MNLNRRGWLAACASVLAARPVFGLDSPDRLGLVIHSFAVRGSDRSFAEASHFLEYVRKLGAGCVQVGIGARDDAAADALREQAQAASMHLEGIVSLPREDGDVDRFEAEIRTAKRAGATVVRTVLLSGRRYETFGSLAA